MRQYMIDEISFLERDTLDSYLKRTLKPSSLEGVFFLAVPDDLLGPEQQGHEDADDGDNHQKFNERKSRSTYVERGNRHRNGPNREMNCRTAIRHGPDRTNFGQV